MGSVREASGAPAEGPLVLYVKAGVDGRRLGACPFCQRVHMVLALKAATRPLNYKVVTTNPAKPPPEFKTLGLKRVPAVIHGDEGFDALDDILAFLEQRFPGGHLEYQNAAADLATKDFFSTFCFYIKAVNQDASKLDLVLQRLDSFLQEKDQDQEGNTPKFLCGSRLTHLDCEVLPKLQHLRVAAKVLKNYDIPTQLRGFWRYLHAAYTHPVFVSTSPSDQEIILHWHDRPETPKLSHKQHSLIAKEKPKFSFDVPVHASMVTIIDE